MIVIVSKTMEVNFKQCKTVKSLKEVRDLLSRNVDISVLVIHDFDEQLFEAGVFISEFQSQSVAKILYINSNPEPMLTMPVKGVKGYIYEDEFYLEDEDELLALLDEIGLSSSDSTALAAMGGTAEIIKDFIEGFSRDEQRIKAPIYLQQVNAALDELLATTQRQNLEITELGTSALQVYKKASDIITSLNQQNKAIEKKLDELEANEANKPVRMPMANSALYYPSVKYMGGNNVLVIREYSPCRYLTSFVLAYAHYLHYEKNKRVKVIFVIGKGAGVLTKYSQFSTITQESANLSALYEDETVVTNIPKNDLMMKLLKQPTDVTIVVDRLYGSTDIVTGKVKKLCAVSGHSDINRYKNSGCLINQAIFTTVNHSNVGAFGYIPHIKSFPKDSDARLAMYAQNCDILFDKVDKYLGI